MDFVSVEVEDTLADTDPVPEDEGERLGEKEGLEDRVRVVVRVGNAVGHFPVTKSH